MRVRDAETGEEFAVRAANVVNATGVWADRIRPEELHDEAEVPIIRPSRGTHVTLAQRAAAADGGRDRPGRRRAHDLRRCRGSGQTLIGTTDNDYDGDIDHVQPADDDVDYLLDAINAFFGTELGAARPRRRLRRACGR